MVGGVSGDGQSGEARGLDLGYVVYQQIASVIGAFALIAFAEHVWDVGWRGILADLIAQWDLYVRPAVKFILDVTVVAFFAWAIDWHIEVPLFARDYLSVGFMMLLSNWRAVNYELRQAAGSFTQTLVASARSPLNWLFTVLNIALWPVMLVLLLLSVLAALALLRLDRRAPDILVNRVLWLSPAIYFALLFAANAFLLPPVA